MKALIAIVAIAGLLPACGTGHTHSKLNQHAAVNSVQVAEKVKDPVCAMMIDKSASKAHEEYKGGHYYFCSTECHTKFKAAPEKYAK